MVWLMCTPRLSSLTGLNIRGREEVQCWWEVGGGGGLGGAKKIYLINSVEGGVARVKLDGGEDSLSSGGGVGYGVVGKSGGQGSGDSRGNIGNNVSGGTGIQTSEGETVSKAKGGSGSDDLSGTTLSGSSNSGVSSGVFGLSSGNLGGIYGSNKGSRVEGGSNKGFGVEDGGGKGSDLRDGGADRGVGSNNLESGERVSTVVDSLDKTVSINLLVTASHNTKSIAGLSSGRWTTGVTESILSKLILSMELGRLDRSWSKGPGGCCTDDSAEGGGSQKLGAGSTHASCQYNKSVHLEFL